MLVGPRLCPRGFLKMGRFILFRFDFFFFFAQGAVVYFSDSASGCHWSSLCELSRAALSIGNLCAEAGGFHFCATLSLLYVLIWLPLATRSSWSVASCDWETKFLIFKMLTTSYFNSHAWLVFALLSRRALDPVIHWRMPNEDALILLFFFTYSLEYFHKEKLPVFN